MVAKGEKEWGWGKGGDEHKQKQSRTERGHKKNGYRNGDGVLNRWGITPGQKMSGEKLVQRGDHGRW